MNEMLLRVRRGDGCDCNRITLMPDGQTIRFGIIEQVNAPTVPFANVWCPHGSTVEVLKARVVKCKKCAGVGWILRHPCNYCLGTGLRLGEIGDQHGEEAATV